MVKLGDAVEVAGWRLEVADASGRRAARVLLRAPLDDGARDDDKRDDGRSASADTEPGARR
ncbi:hypothetical protein SALBM217S_02093 [Streptomyces griseoloalbus]